MANFPVDKHDGQPASVQVDDLPAQCPACNDSRPKRLGAHADQPIRGATYEILSVWVCRRCRVLFAALYRVVYDHDREIARLLTQAPLHYQQPEIFPAIVATISPTFVEAYNQ